MSLSEMAKELDRLRQHGVVLTEEGLEVEVWPLDVREVFGRLQIRVAPRRGSQSPSAWVSIKRLRTLDNPALTVAEERP